MKKSRFNEAQIIGVLREQEAGSPMAEVCQRHGISEQTLYRWKAKYGSMDIFDAKRLKALEEESGKLKQLLAEAMLGIEPLSAIVPRTIARGAEGSAQPKMVTPAARRTAVAHLTEAHEISERLACRVIAADRSSVRYRAERTDDTPVQERLWTLAAERRRWSCLR